MDDMRVGKEETVLRNEDAAAKGKRMGFIVDTDDESRRVFAGTVQIAGRQPPRGPRGEEPQNRNDADGEEETMMSCESDRTTSVQRVYLH